MVFVIWYRYRKQRILDFKRWEIALTVVFCSFAMGVGAYCYYNLPLIDFLPYKKGANIYDMITAILDAAGVIAETANKGTIMKTIMPMSNVKILLYCQKCGAQNDIMPNTLFQRGFHCSLCSDGISFPNKFMYSVFTQLGIDFETEFTPPFLPSLRCDHTYYHKQ
mgnify:CR=1 FL=1